MGNIWGFCIFVSMVSFGQEALIVSKTLEESFSAALNRSETIIEQTESVNQARERKSQALSAILPSITSSATYQRQQPLTDPVINNIFPSEQTNWKVSATQPIFHGLRDFAALSQTRHQLESQEQLKAQQIQQLYIAVAQCFYSLQSSNDEIKQLVKEIEINQNRLKELKSFNYSGRNRQSDVYSLEASVYTLEAQLNALQTQQASNQELYHFLTDFPGDVLLIKDEDRTKKQLGPIEELLKKTSSRPDVKAAREDFKSSDAGVSIAWGQHLPSVDLTGNYYLLRSAGPLKDVTWDIQVTASIPVWQWGAIQSQVDAASADRHSKEMRLARITRQAEQEIRTLYASIRSEQTQVEKLKLAYEFSKKNVSAVEKDHKRGLNTTTDLLTAEANAQQILRNLTRTQYGLKIDWMRLEVATNQKPKI